MTAALHRLSLPGVMLQRGFWLYVWDIRACDQRLLYVGRTGDESSPHASAPNDRFGQHLGRNKNANALRRNLLARGVKLAHVDHYDFHFFGPIHPEAADMDWCRRVRGTAGSTISWRRWRKSGPTAFLRRAMMC